MASTMGLITSIVLTGPVRAAPAWSALVRFNSDHVTRKCVAK